MEFTAAWLLANSAWLYQFLYAEIVDHPFHVAIEIVFVLCLIYFSFFVPVRRAGNPKYEPLTEKEVTEILDEFHSESFNTTVDSNAKGLVPLTVSSYQGPYLTLKDDPKKKLINLTTFDFLSLSTHPRVVEAAVNAVEEFGVGSCGPRGFYGTIKPHLDVEENLSAFLRTHSCITYSFAFATTSTMIPCFCSRSDFIVADEKVNLILQQGCILSRATVSHFRHNDMEHLEQLLEGIVKTEKKNGRKLTRRWVLTEGIFRNTGDICNLPAIVALCKKYKFRVMLDDTYGFGVLGRTGRGTPEHFDMTTNDVEVYAGAMSTSLGSVGGFCAGSDIVVDHQRLAASGYVFSASLPPYCSIAASAALAILDENPNLARQMQARAIQFRSSMREQKLPPIVEMVPCVGDASPLVHFTIKCAVVDVQRKSARGSKMPSPSEDEALQRVVETLQSDGIIATRSLFNREESVDCRASLRLALKAELSEAEVDACVKKVAKAFIQVASNFQRLRETSKQGGGGG